MRTVVCPGLCLLVAAAGVGCDSDEPLETEGQVASLSFLAPSSEVDSYAVFDLIENSDGVPGADDVDGDGVPGDVSLWCELPQSAFSPPSVPWAFSVEVKILRAGETTKQTLVSSLAVNDNIAAYDTSSSPGPSAKPAVTLMHEDGECSQNTNITCNPDNLLVDVCARENAGFCKRKGRCDGDPAEECTLITDINQCLLPNGGCDCPAFGLGSCVNGFCDGVPPPTMIECEPNCVESGQGTSCDRFDITRVFEYLPSRRLSAANREVLASTSNFLSDADFATFQGNICPGTDLGDDGILRQGQPFTFTLAKGDTVFVEARRFNQTPPGIDFDLDPELVATLQVDGQSVEVDGDSATTPITDAIDFTYTTR